MAFGGDGELLEVGLQGRKLGLEEGFFSYPISLLFSDTGGAAQFTATSVLRCQEPTKLLGLPTMG